jgi:hypothetical protein
MDFETQIRNALPYQIGAKVLFYSPDADKEFEGEINAVEISINRTEIDCSWWVMAHNAGHHSGRHIIPTKYLIHNL